MVGRSAGSWARRGCRTALASAAGFGFAVPPALAQRSDIVVVAGKDDDAPAKLKHILPEVDGTRITVTKKASTTLLDEQPTVIDNNLQQVFARTPGLLVTDQQTPSQFNINYRGLGNPQESEFILALQDGLPISTDWIGFPTLYYVPLTQGIAQVQLVRGGSSLLYGPNPAPAINFVSKRPRPGEPVHAYSEDTGGSDGLFSSYNAVEGTLGTFEFRGSYGHVQSDGQRQNADSRLDQGDLYLGVRPKAGMRLYVEAHRYMVDAGDPGRIGYAQFLSDPTFAPTPANRDWVRRTALIAGFDADLGRRWSLEAKGWAVWQTLQNRAAAAQAPGAAPPASTTVTDERFRNQGVDLRAVHRWGRGDALTIGAVAYRDDAPFLQWVNPNILAPRGSTAGTPRLDQQRSSAYQALFAEAVFRLPHKFHVVPSARLEHESITITESVRPANLVRPLIDQSLSRVVPLFGLGAGFDFGRQNETYFSVSQGYRPVRFFDVASPFANVGPGNLADPQKSLAWEAGVHGTPVLGLFYDASLFWIDFRNRIETIVLSATDSININSGDTRHRGLEGELSYDLLAARQGADHLVLFGNVSLLDARFVASQLAGRVGNRPAYAPALTAKYGLTLRRDRTFAVSATGISVSSQFFQDSDLPTGSGASFVPAEIPAHTTIDLSGDYYLTRSVRILAGISNLTDLRYYDRVFQNGIEPGRDRRFYGGLALGL